MTYQHFSCVLAIQLETSCASYPRRAVGKEQQQQPVFKNKRCRPWGGRKQPEGRSFIRQNLLVWDRWPEEIYRRTGLPIGWTLCMPGKPRRQQLNTLNFLRPPDPHYTFTSPLRLQVLKTSPVLTTVALGDKNLVLLLPVLSFLVWNDNITYICLCSISVLV